MVQNLSISTPTLDRDTRIAMVRDSIGDITHRQLQEWFADKKPRKNAGQYESAKPQIMTCWMTGLGLKCSLVRGSNLNLQGYAFFAAAKVLDAILSQPALQCFVISLVKEVRVHCVLEPFKPIQLVDGVLHIYKCDYHWEIQEDTLLVLIAAISPALYQSFSVPRQQEFTSAAEFKKDLESIILHSDGLMALRNSINPYRFERVMDFVNAADEAASSPLGPAT